MSRYVQYSPLRIWRVFRFLLTLFLLIKGRKSIFFIQPLSPHGLKDTVTRLGASFVKLSQVLATRADFFEPPYLEELKSLHDELPPMNKKTMMRVFQKAGLEGIFDSFEQSPIASASIGEVHVAYKNKEKFAVKLRREGIKEQVAADVRILRAMNALIRLQYLVQTTYNFPKLKKSAKEKPNAKRR